MAQQIVNRDAANGAGWLWLGRSCEKLRDFDAAAEAYGRASAIPDSAGEAVSRRGFCLLNAGRLGDAEDAFNAALKRNPSDEAAQTELQWLLFNQLRERELEVFLESLLEREPNKFRILYHLLYSSQRRPNPREAVGRLEQVEQLNPGQPQVQLALGHCYWKLSDINKATRFLDAALQQRPADVETMLLVAEFKLEQDEVDSAQALIESLKPRLAADDRWWWLMAQLQHRQAKADNAIDSLKEAIRLRPNEIRYLQTIATWYQAKNLTTESKGFHREAQLLRKVNEELYVLVSRGDLDKPNSEVFRTLGRLFDQGKRPNVSKAWGQLAASKIQ